MPAEAFEKHGAARWLVTDDDRRALAPWAADCAERVLSVFETAAPGDARAREAIAGIRGFAAGDLRKGPLRTLAMSAYAAARDVDDRAAAAAARAAGLAAAIALIHADPATLGSTGHALGPATYAALARELAGGADRSAADAEIRWAIRHASPAVREIVRRLPPVDPGGTRLAAIRNALDSGLRG